MAPFFRWNRRVAAVLIAVCAVSLSTSLAAHDIPADSTVRMFVKPEGQRLHLLVRVQMASINDIDWPVHRDNGYLDLSRVEPFLRDASTMWIADYLDMYEGGTKLAYPTLLSVHLSPEGDTSFATYEDALAHVTGPRISEETNLLSNQGALDVLFDYSIHSDQSRFSMHPRFDRFGLRVVTILRFLSPSGTIRGFEYEGGDPGLVRLDPEWHQAARTFAGMGFQDVLGGIDHLLFLLCLVLPLRRVRAMVLVATTFAAAHSITLIASAFGMAPAASWFPPLIDTLIAASIIYLAIDNVISFRGTGNADQVRVRRRWIAAFAFGLVHGFAFSFPLGQTLQFAGSHMVTSVLSYNVGIECGQLLALALLVPVLKLLFRFVIGERLGTIVLSVLAAHVGWHWVSTRTTQLWRYQFVWPDLTPGFFAGVLRWLMLVVAVAGVWWIGSLLLKATRLSRSSTP